MIHIKISSQNVGSRSSALAFQEFEGTWQAFKIAFPTARWNGSDWTLPVDSTDDVMRFFYTRFPAHRIIVTVTLSTAA